MTRKATAQRPRSRLVISLLLALAGVLCIFCSTLGSTISRWAADLPVDAATTTAQQITNGDWEIVVGIDEGWTWYLNDDDEAPYDFETSLTPGDYISTTFSVNLEGTKLQADHLRVVIDDVIEETEGCELEAEHSSGLPCESNAILDVSGKVEDDLTITVTIARDVNGAGGLEEADVFLGRYRITVVQVPEQ